MSAFNINTAAFAGKYSFSTTDNTLLISLSAAGAGTTLDAEAGNANSPGTNQMFNLYGDMQAGFVLQAPNWQYVWFNNGYVAEKSRTDAACSVFSIQAEGSNICIVETSGGTSYYVIVVTGNSLSRIANTGTPPANALFVQTKITDSLAVIRKQHGTRGYPLTGVYLAGQNLTNIGFMDTDLSDAILSNTVLDKTSNFNAAIANNTTFDEAKMGGWVGNGLTFTNCSFVNASMAGASMYSSILNGCTFNKADFTGANLQDSDFTNAFLVGCNFLNAKVNAATFKGATLTNADLSGAVGVETIISFEGALLIAANIKGHDLTQVLIDTDTNFMNAMMDGCNLTGKTLTNNVFVRASMQNVKLDNAVLNGAQMAFANLSNATITGGVSMIGANLANANLQGVQLPGAQLGAKTTLFSLPLSDSSQLDILQIPADLKADLNLSAQATVQLVQAGINWLVTDGKNQYQVNNNTYNLLVQNINTSNAAVLSNAYMLQANLQQANLYAVEMSGVHWYGANASALSADMGQANLSNAFLSNMNFKQCMMQGASLDYATLISTVFDGANLSPSATLKPTSFAFASMQSTSFTGASNLFNANLTNAAISLQNGVPLFTIDTSFVATLNSQVLSAALQTAFTNVAYALVGPATVTVGAPGANWAIANTDTTNVTQTGYGNFYLELVNQDNGLSYIQVYGASPLLVLNADGKGGQVQIPLVFAASCITTDQLNNDTTCPSGMKFRYLSDYMTYEALMTPALPPKPPTCLNCWD